MNGMKNKVEIRVTANSRGSRLYVEVPDLLMKLGTGAGPKKLRKEAAAIIGDAVLDQVLHAVGRDIAPDGVIVVSDGQGVDTFPERGPIPLEKEASTR